MDKLKELTDKLYSEGLSKGRQEAEALVADAKQKAAEIVENAKKEAEAIKAKAAAEASELTSRTQSDVKMASAQAIQAVKTDIENLVVASLQGDEVSKALSSEEFVKSIITAVAQKFDAAENTDITLVLPESLQKELEPFVKKELCSVLKNSVEGKFSKKVSGGFCIGPKDGSWFVSLTDETFKELICEYLRPVAKKVLFG